MSDIAKSPAPSGGRRLDVLRLVQAADEPLSIAQIADELGVHPNTVRFHLDTLVEEGRVEHTATDHKGRGRPALMFRAIRQMDRGGTRRFRLLAEILTMGLAADADPSTKALAAGRAWGQRLRPLQPPDGPVDADDSTGQLLEMLDELGFEPETLDPDTTGEEQFGLRHCPFLELAETSAEVVCPIHQGLMQGVLEAWGSPLTVDRLDPFYEPDLCVAHLKPAADNGTPVARSAPGVTRTAGSTG
ncbi:transcriptional regulator [Mycolicibacter engbaekii]|uniref:Transcriptional regulator n=1 Tax=Mycolicibacter engbaekii TaxID=188915 RepID=A0A1X1U1P7_9MYCO|nr:helix-turn-helix domain-containing protein [Mycolicibacter engbaekii]ORV50770.1 transcriptional regulator [Mycolicibacter engbaekii]